MALQQDPRKRSPRYTETYSKRNYQPSKKPLVLITAGIVACTVAVAAVAVSCQGGLDLGGDSNSGTVIDDPSNSGGDTPSNDGDTSNSSGNGNKTDSDKTNNDKNAGSGGRSSNSAGDGTDSNSGSNNNSSDNADGNTNGESAASNKYVPGQSIQVPSSTSSSSGGSAFNKPTVTVSFTPDREKASLERYYKRLSGKTSQLSEFCEDVFNEHLGSSYSTIVKDYDKFEKLRKKILNGIVDEDGDWTIYTFYGDKYLDAKVNMAKASKLLVQRLDMLDEAYQAMFALGRGASSSEYAEAASGKLKDFASVTKKMNTLVKSAKSSMGL